MSHDPSDCFESGLSSCCSARVMLGGICSQCKEHCDTEPTEIEMHYEAQVNAAQDALEAAQQRGDSVAVRRYSNLLEIARNAAGKP